MRSSLAGLAAIWFAYNAAVFIPPGGGVYVNPGSVDGLDGDPGAVAVTFAVRMLCIGLAILSVALMEWHRLSELRSFLMPSTDEPAAGPDEARP